MAMRAVIGLSLLSLVACGGNAVDDALDQTERNIETACACFEDLDFASRAGCVAEGLAAARLTPSEEACIREVYETNAGAVPYVECYLQAQIDLGTCLEGVVDPCNAGGLATCGGRFDGALIACLGEITASALAEIGDCLE
jgi:hypothetical protein